MVRKMFSCDFETTTDPNDCRVWAYGWMEIGNFDNYHIGNSLDEFMLWCEKVKADLYFHNLKFDGEFIVIWLLENGFLCNDSGQPKTFKPIISKMGQWYAIDICYGYRGKRKLHTVIYDSLKKLPFKVKEIAEDFNLPILKGDIDYEAYRPVGHEITESEYEYIKNDIEIIARALDIQFKQGLTKMTTGSDALGGFKSMISKKGFEKLFPTMTFEVDQKIRLAYKGGFTYLNEKYARRVLGTGRVYDVNSMYSHVMYDKPLPFGVPMPYIGQYVNDENFPLYIQHIRCGFELKEGKIPVIQIKRDDRFRSNQYLKSSNFEIVDLYVTNVDLELIQKHYKLYSLEYVNGWKFRSKVGLFRQYIDKWMHIKNTSEGAVRLLAKLMLNALYGKFASNPDVTGKVPYLKDDGSLGLRTGDEEYKDPVYTPMGCFITAWARHNTITTAQKCYDRFVYADTDSIHITGDDTPEAIKDIIHPKKLGYWDHETTFKRGKYIRQKTYFIERCYKTIVVDGKEKDITCSPDEATKIKKKVVCAGMQDDIKKRVTFDEFDVGYTDIRLAPKHVKGGIVLVDTPFSIK